MSGLITGVTLAAAANVPNVGAGSQVSPTTLAMALGGSVVGLVATQLERLLAGGRGNRPTEITDLMGGRFPKASTSGDPTVCYVHQGVAEIGQKHLAVLAEEQRMAKQAAAHAVVDCGAQISAMMGNAFLAGDDATFLGVAAAGTIASALTNANNPATTFYGKKSWLARTLGYFQAATGPAIAFTVGLLTLDPALAALAGGCSRVLLSFVPSNIGVKRESVALSKAFEAGKDALARYEAGLLTEKDLLSEYAEIKKGLPS